ncbi:MAG: gliding motility-associated C-terminal domain-containing protein [Flavobacteriales bacterium]
MNAFRVISAATSLAVLLLLSAPATATHNRAGEIVYEHITGFTYKVTIITVTKASAYADRPYLKIYWGDEPSNVLESQLDSLERVVELFLTGVDAKRNEYIGYHTYTGPGIFNLVVEDPNRNAGVINIPQSVWQVFSIRSVLVISPLTGHNNSVQLLNPPIQNACFMQPWIHNPAAYDPDGDQLVYSLIPCTGLDSEPILGWALPDASTDTWPDDVFAIDAQTGDVTWLVPPWPGEFNIAILIEEFRNGVFVGSVVRDMQITVALCSNQPPVINPLPDVCVEAGENVSFDVDWFDPDNHQITAAAYGGPLSQVENQATFNVVSGQFNWAPQCEEVRPEPYAVTFTATDNGNVNLTGMETVRITVVAPRVENPLATPQGSGINLSWDIHPCEAIFSQFTAAQVRYKIYRRVGLFGFDPGPCELGVPEYTGYSFIGEVSGLSNTSYQDLEVVLGNTYCYMVVTCFPNGSISYASEEFCAQAIKEAPVLTKVSIGNTDMTVGVDTIWWSPPTDLDLTIYTGPYQYKLYHATGGGNPSDLIYESSISADLGFSDTLFVHQNINTEEQDHHYRVDLYSDGQLVFPSNQASSVYLVTEPMDNAVALDIQFSVPWENYAYHIYRKGPGESSFTLIATTDEPTWTDEELLNNQEYCYYVIAEGSYGNPTVPDPLFNYSQQVCARPYDQTPPCAPQLSWLSNCADGINEFIWNNPNNTCADDVTGYNIYYAAVEGEPLELYATISTAGDTTFIFTGEDPVFSLAGCFAVTALDSLNLWPDGNLYQNESPLSNIICLDNCPIFYLPNIFTPNGDGLNDQFVPFEHRHVRDIDLKVFNRWGTLVFETNDPDINWGGVSSETGQMVADGPYYYVVQVNTIRLSGIVPERFAGTIQIQDGRPPAPSN